MKLKNMIVRYDNDIDAIYFELTENKIDSTEAETDRIIIDYDKENNIVGVEILDFQYLIKKGLTVNDLPFSDSDKLIATKYFK